MLLLLLQQSSDAIRRIHMYVFVVVSGVIVVKVSCAPIGNADRVDFAKGWTRLFVVSIFVIFLVILLVGAMVTGKLQAICRVV